jgi:hypothetical protein
MTNSEGFIRCVTHLYDKRRERCYDHIEVVQYTPPVAGLAESCLYNIFIGQLFRYQRIITDVDNFKEEVAMLASKLVAVGYKDATLHAKLKRHINNHRYVFPKQKSMGQLVQGGFSRVGAVSIGWTGIHVYICFSCQQCLQLPVSDLARSRDNTACQVNGLV